MCAACGGMTDEFTVAAQTGHCLYANRSANVGILM